VNIRYQILLIFLFISTFCLADDVGVAEVRLFEEKNNTYALEVDISPALLNTIQPPILPDRCSFISKPERNRVGPMLVVRYRFSSGDIPLQAEDELLLYWQRSGIILTAYWLDGSSRRIFVDRELAGFRVPLSLLHENEVTLQRLFLESSSDAVNHMREFWLIFLLLMAALASRESMNKLLKFFIAFAGGQGISLLAIDLGLPGLPPSMIPMLVLLAILFLLFAPLLNAFKNKRIWPVLMLLGLIHGLSYSGPNLVQSESLTRIDLIKAQLIYNLLMDLGIFLGSISFFGLFTLLRKRKLLKPIQRLANLTMGGLVVATLLTQIPGALEAASSESSAQLADLSGNLSMKSRTGNPSRPVDMEDPMMGFITINPFEIRCEWLVRVRDLAPETIPDEEGIDVIPVDWQEAFKTKLLTRLASNTLISSDGISLQASKIRADFVSVGSYGVSTRNEPLSEPLDLAVIGVTLAYALDEAPSNVKVELLSFPGYISAIPLSFTDPWGSTAHTLSTHSAVVEWKRRMAGFRRPLIQEVQIEPLTWPAISSVLLILAFALATIIRKGLTIRYRDAILVLLVGTAILVYPFLRLNAPSFISRNIASEESSGKALNLLLTNIYRAFDYQTEEAVYDQLAISTMGDQLAGIYLEHQSAMELEDRGGARASVDQVSVTDIRDVRRTDENIIIEAIWEVSGSVSHFGHIHYRKNLYDARVFIKAIDGAWKISGMEVMEKERIL
jgi:hypothetical protein